MSNFELRRRHDELNRLHADVTCTFRELMATSIVDEDRAIVRNMLAAHSMEFWPAVSSYDAMLHERGFSTTANEHKRCNTTE